MPCPLAANNSKYFSHEVRKFKPAETVEKINRPLNLEIREVKFGLSMLGTARPLEIVKENQVCRIISPLKKRKGTVSFIGMSHKGIENNYELQRRNLLKEELKELMHLTRGDIIEIDGSFKTAPTSERIRIDELRQIKILFAPRLS